MADQSTDQSLKDLFKSADAKRREVELSPDPRLEAYHTTLASAIALFENCQQLSDRLQLFSPNETLDDVATNDLQYLLIDYRLADLLGRVSNRDRYKVLRDSQAAYERFLKRIDQYEILSSADRKLYERYTEDPANFSTIPISDPAARRAAKIANYKQEKELKEKLEYYSRHARDNQDDAALRDLQLANLQLCIHNTFQSLESMKLEFEILAMAPTATLTDPGSAQADRRDRTNGSRGGVEYSDRLDPPISQLLSNGNSGPILSSSGKPLKPFTLLDTRQRLQDGVFKPGHNLPTMTIDEYLEEERRRGGIIEGGGEASGVIPEPDEDNYEKADEETMKARAWDEFVEANPKGSGNTLNRG